MENLKFIPFILLGVTLFFVFFFLFRENKKVYLFSFYSVYERSKSGAKILYVDASLRYLGRNLHNLLLDSQQRNKLIGTFKPSDSVFIVADPFDCEFRAIETFCKKISEQTPKENRPSLVILTKYPKNESIKSLRRFGFEIEKISSKQIEMDSRRLQNLGVIPKSEPVNHLV